MPTSTFSTADTETAERLQDIEYIDRPDIELPTTTDKAGGADASESVNMPFKYVRGEDGKPVMPKVSCPVFHIALEILTKPNLVQGMLELLASDADKDILDLL